MIKKILILGGTGLLGRPVLRALQDAGFETRLMTRNKGKALPIVGPSTEVVEGEVQEVDRLRQAVKGCQGVHISIGGDVDQLSAENVSAVARGEGVERVSYISGATASEENRWFPMTAQKLNAEMAIRNSGVPFTIFCPTWPMEMLVRFARGGEPTIIGRQPRPLHWFAADDLGRMVAIAYQKEEAANKRFYVHGPEGIPMRDALERYCTVFHPGGKPVKVLPLGMANAIGILTRNKALRFATKLMAYFDKIGEMGDPTEANAMLGTPETTLAEWMKLQQAKTSE